MGVIAFRDDSIVGISRNLFYHILTFFVERSDRKEVFKEIRQEFEYNGCMLEVDNMRPDVREEFIILLKKYLNERAFEETYFASLEVEQLINEIIKKMS